MRSKPLSLPCEGHLKDLRSLSYSISLRSCKQVDKGLMPVGISTMTACMVRLGLLGTVHDIVVSLCEQDRADAVAAVTAGLLSQGEVVIVTRITNALVASGHSDHATTISGSLLIHFSSIFWFSEKPYSHRRSAGIGTCTNIFQGSSITNNAKK